METISSTQSRLLQKNVFLTQVNPGNQNSTDSHSIAFSREMINALINNGYSKAKIADVIGIAVSTINRILRGVNNPGNQTFARLLRLYCATCYTDVSK